MNVLITGASRGIGRAIANEFSNENLFLFCNKNFASLDEIANRKNINIIKCDMQNYTSLNELVEGIHIDVLINNAGISSLDLYNTTSYEDIKAVIDINLYAPMYLTRLLLPSMISNKHGNIINISSVWGEIGASMEVAYSTAKAGLNGFTRALAKEVAPSKIRVNAISCGLIDTDMNKKINPDDLKNLIYEIPMGRMGNVNEIAKLCKFLSSNDSSYITGQVIRADGGWI
ncbi:MAG: elongation factor P 5-aminopentanone reductase [Lachnospirales bacterium]